MAEIVKQFRNRFKGASQWSEWFNGTPKHMLTAYDWELRTLQVISEPHAAPSTLPQEEQTDADRAARSSGTGAPPAPLELAQSQGAEVNHTEPVEHDPYVKKAVAAAMTLLEESWRATLRKERDARLTEVRLKEKFKLEVAQLQKERDAAYDAVGAWQVKCHELEARVEALQKGISQ